MTADTKKFLAALSLAAIYSRRPFWSLVVAGLKATVLYPLAKKTDAATFKARMECCEGCSVRFESLNTCGSPLSDSPEEGCWCYLPRLARLGKGHCWLSESGLSGGWES